MLSPPATARSLLPRDKHMGIPKKLPFRFYFMYIQSKLVESVISLNIGESYVSKCNFNGNSIEICQNDFKIRFISILEDLNCNNF